MYRLMNLDSFPVIAGETMLTRDSCAFASSVGVIGFFLVLIAYPPTGAGGTMKILQDTVYVALQP